jgi:hypothetical protein
MSWHVDDTTAARYVRRDLGPADAASVEAHLVHCSPCRGVVGGLAGGVIGGPRLEDVWAGIVDVLDQPQLGTVERLLVRLGLSETAARVIAATPRARWSYLFAVALSMIVAVVAVRSGDQRTFGVFLLVAPLAPLVATATAFGPRSDPTHHLVATLPMPSLRVLLLRTAATVTPAVVLTAASSLWLADQGWLAAAWLLPALALALAALALSSWVAIEVAAILVGGAWVTVPIVLRLPVADLLDLLGGPAQLAAVLVATGAVVVTVSRRSAFDYQEA